MIDFSESILSKLAVHKVGNKNNNEALSLSEELVPLSNPGLSQALLTYFLSPFGEVEYHRFDFSNGDVHLNPVYTFVNQMFEQPESFLNKSVDAAKHLYAISEHPQIKTGDLFVAHIKNIAVDGVRTDAIGIFKSESKQPFIKVHSAQKNFILECEDGININKMDKGCIILNTDVETGFKLGIIDKSNKAGEALFWKEKFLNVRPCSDDYHHTKDFLSITKNFVTKQLTEEFEVSKADQIDLLNRSVDYFKSNETFNKNDFEEQVFKDENVISSFRTFDQAYRSENEVPNFDDFEISAQAVKKQARVFKSVLKLDKNFHIYIHGNRNLIEKGKEADGRKYYKIYYEDEQ
ncbi:MAG: hypothetical protein ACI8ZN_002590 [Bacteroidia bacterium]|jgi:hypothetical protein